MTPFCGFGCWTTRDEFVIPMGLYSIAASDFNRLSNEKRVYTSLVLEGEFDCLSNRVFEFDLDDIRAIRAKQSLDFARRSLSFLGVKKWRICRQNLTQFAVTDVGMSGAGMRGHLC